MQDLLNLHALQSALNNDPEFGLASRHWNIDLCLKVDESEAIVLIRDGKVVGLNLTPGPLDAWDLVIAAPARVWTELLSPVPRPFYQDFFPAMLYHGLTMRGDLASLFAYYPAVRRMGDVMRHVTNSSGAGEAAGG
jgi:hypothetical protein